MSEYRSALRAVVTSESKAYGFTLVIWDTGAIAVGTRGGPGVAGAIGYVFGGLGAMTIVIFVVRGSYGDHELAGASSVS
jgi:hypothetical protein